MNFTTLALLSAIFGALGNVLAPSLLQQFKARHLLTVTFLTMAGILLLLSPWFFHFTITLYNVVLLVIIATLDTAGNYFYFKSFAKAPASLVTPLLALAPAFAFICSWLILNDTVSWFTYVLSALIIGGIILFSLDFSNLKKFSKTTLLPALAAAGLFGSSAIPTKILLTTAEAINAPTLYMLRAGIIGIVALILFGWPRQSLTFKNYQKIFGRSVIVIISWLLLYYALAKGNAGVATTLNNTAPVFVFIISVIFLKEKVTIKKLLTAALVFMLALIL